MSTPDVTVIVPVYNTRPYLGACLDSLTAQTIGHERMQVVAVDDGSTDGSGELLDLYAERHPELFVVLHQANSGGPAKPCNVGLGVATGRYVFFLGSDDHLGVEALARMVAKADEWASDVVCVRLVGTNGRRINQRLFGENEPDLPFPDQRPFFAANTKLFRRSVLEEHHVRYQEDIRIASDQTFTIEAMYHSARISVLADYDYYFALLRPDSGNITHRPEWRPRLDDIDATMVYIERLIGPGDVLDGVLVRHLKWEYGNRLRDLDELPDEDQAALVERTREVCDRYLNDGVLRLLPVAARLRLRYAQAGDLAALKELNRSAGEYDRAPVLVREGRVLLAYPGFEEPGGPPVDWFEMTDDLPTLRARLSARAVEARVEAGSLLLEVELGLDESLAASARVELHQVGSGVAVMPPRARVVAVTGVDDRSSRITLAVDAAELVARSDHTWVVRCLLAVVGEDLTVSVRADRRLRARFEDHVLVARPGIRQRLVLLARHRDSAPPSDPGQPSLDAPAG